MKIDIQSHKIFTALTSTAVSAFLTVLMLELDEHLWMHWSLLSTTATLKTQRKKTLAHLFVRAIRYNMQRIGLHANSNTISRRLEIFAIAKTTTTTNPQIRVSHFYCLFIYLLSNSWGDSILQTPKSVPMKAISIVTVCSLFKPMSSNLHYPYAGLILYGTRCQRKVPDH